VLNGAKSFKMPEFIDLSSSSTGLNSPKSKEELNTFRNYKANATVYIKNTKTQIFTTL